MKIKKIINVIILCAAFLAATLQTGGAQTSDDALLTAWLDAQAHIQTWSADFTQIRNLKTLTQPLIATGRVSFAAPNQFRWEIIKPSPSLALRAPDELLVIYPNLKRAEKYPLNAAAAGPWKDTLALLDAGFPRSRSDVESRFRILSQTTTNGIHELTLQPKAENARRFMPEIRISFDTNNYSLHATELKFTDGSTMQNVFTNAVTNPKFTDATFTYATEGFKIIEPFKK